MSKLEIGDLFIATIKKGIRSRTFAGDEAAGKRFGPFAVTGTTTIAVLATDNNNEERVFQYRMFMIKKV